MYITHTSWLFGGTNCVNINLTKLRIRCLFCSSHFSHGEHNMAFVRGAPSFWLKETVSTVWDPLFMGRYPDGSNEAFLLTTHLLKIPNHHKVQTRNIFLSSLLCFFPVSQLAIMSWTPTIFKLGYAELHYVDYIYL